MLKDIPIFHKTYELMLWVYIAVNKFPKKQRFVLGQEIEKTAIKFLKLCSPKAQRIASTMLDFPEPFGPTIAVKRQGKSKTVFPEKDLKFFKIIRFKNIKYYFHPFLERAFFAAFTSASCLE